MGDIVNKIGLAKLLDEMEEYESLIASIKDGFGPANVIGVSESAFAHLVFCVQQRLKKTTLIITADSVTAKKTAEDLREFYNDVVLFPEKELILYDIDASSSDVIKERLSAIEVISCGGAIVVTTVTALVQSCCPMEYYKNITELKVGTNCVNIVELLVELGYTRESIVEGRGQFSVRGGIVDFFPYSYGENPIRVELFGDTVDSIREFDPINQRSTEMLESARITPASEIIITDELRKKLATQAFTPQDKERFNENINFPSIDRYIPLIFNEIPILLDYLENSIVFVHEPQRVSMSAEISYNNLFTAMEKHNLVDHGDYYYDYRAVWKRLAKETLIGVSGLSHICPDYRPRDIFNITSKVQSRFNNIEMFLETVSYYNKNKYRIVIFAGTELKANNVAKSLCDQGFDAEYLQEVGDVSEKIVVTTGELGRGFEYPLIHCAVISDSMLFGTQKQRARHANKKNQKRLESYSDLRIGDFVVHQNHGIGQFVGIKTLTIEGASSDYLEIRYRGDDKLFIPTNQLNLIYKYIGRDATQIKCNKLGGTEWNKTRQKVKKACQDMAEQLIKIYAARHTLEGIAFDEDKPWQIQFEDAFPYEETEDQLRCIQEVKHDMELARPMDRLICGDVGYGKTEVALRAAFKAVLDGYQVAYLVPTTILASQHYSTFVQRIKNFPVTVEMLSRFKSLQQQKKIIKRVNQGEVDILIGTHRILQKDIDFKKLGLLIIDEEQRFGVAHKERIKELKSSIDVLTLTATPIPRTLHMSMVGIRDMSIIENPPKDRYPVSTYVLEYNEEIVNEAILREVGRGGQVYYLHNRVQSIFKVAANISKLDEQLRVGVAHGQMSEQELEEVMLKVLNGEIDVLVCTTIIETGLDIPNINTIIVEDADRMGLAQLYQLRGRVGRSNRLAYAYLTYKREKVLSEVAEKRLKAISEFTEFGSGFKIALRDLEIRGAGNVIGAQQHGHMDAVGYDLYCKLLAEAVAEQKNEPSAIEVQTVINLPLDAYIPKEFIKSEDFRIEMYKRIASITNEQDSFDVCEEIIDRYGNPPKQVLSLIDIALLRAKAQDVGVADISQKGHNVVVTFDERVSLDIERLSVAMSRMKGKLLFSAGEKPYLTLRGGGLTNVKFMLNELSGIANY